MHKLTYHCFNLTILNMECSWVLITTFMLIFSHKFVFPWQKIADKINTCIQEKVNNQLMEVLTDSTKYL